MQNILFFLLCALLTGCHAGTSRPELPEMVEYSGPNASSLRTFIESIEVIKLDHRESITVGAYNAIRSDSNSFYVGDMLNGSNLVYRFDRKGEFLDSIGKIGRAPGEYLGLSDFYSDPETDELYILSGQDVQLYRYHKNGRFIDQREVPDRTQSFIKLGPQFWFYEGYNNGKYPERLTDRFGFASDGEIPSDGNQDTGSQYRPFAHPASKRSLSFHRPRTGDLPDYPRQCRSFPEIRFWEI